MVLLRNYSIHCCYLLYSQTIRTILCSLLLAISQQLFDAQSTPCSSVQSTITIYIVTSLPIQRVFAPLYARRLLYSHKHIGKFLVSIQSFTIQSIRVFLFFLHFQLFSVLTEYLQFACCFFTLSPGLFSTLKLFVTCYNPTLSTNYNES